MFFSRFNLSRSKHTMPRLHHQILAVGFCVLASLVFPNVGLSQLESAVATDASQTATPPPASSVDPALASMLGSPRATMQTFLKAFKYDEDRHKAPLCLDLSGLNKETAEAKAEELATKLKQIIDRMVLVEYAYVPDNADRTEEFSLRELAEDSAIERTKDFFSEEELVDIDRIRLCRSKEDGLWRFCKETVAHIDDLWSEWVQKEKVASQQDEADDEIFSTWWAKRFPESMRTEEAGGVLLGLPKYLWLTLLIVIALGFIADLGVRLVLNALTSAWLRFYHADVDDLARRKMWRPVGFLVQAWTWLQGTKLSGFPIGFTDVLLIGLKFVSVIAAIWTAFRIIDVLASHMAKRASKTSSKFDDLIVPLVSKLLKVLIVIVGIIVFVDVFGDDWKTALGGMGIGGLAIAFAAKDTIGNFFGSLTVLFDRPFEVGDWIATEGIEGTVETVGLRSTRIRTFYDSQITLPNSRLTTAVVDNYGRRKYRRIRTTLGVQYDTTPEQIDAFCEGIRELIRIHPYTRKDYYHVYLNEFSASSLDVMLYCFVECPDWSVELREKHRLYADIIRLAKELNVEFAFPTSTLHLFREEHSPESEPPGIEQPSDIGRRLAAQIAGPPVRGAQRPGRVEFPGPAKFNDDVA